MHDDMSTVFAASPVKVAAGHVGGLVPNCKTYGPTEQRGLRLAVGRPMLRTAAAKRGGDGSDVSTFQGAAGHGERGFCLRLRAVPSDQEPEAQINGRAPKWPNYVVDLVAAVVVAASWARPKLAN